MTTCFPLEVVKTRMQVQGASENTGRYGIWSLRRIVAEEGLRGLYRGYYVSLTCIPLFHTIYFPLYEKVKLHFKNDHGWDENSFKLYSLSAGISGLFCNVITNPFWVVRTRMQAEIFRSMCEDHYNLKY